MCHPGHPDRELLAGSSYAAERAREVEIALRPGRSACGCGTRASSSSRSARSEPETVTVTLRPSRLRVLESAASVAASGSDRPRRDSAAARSDDLLVLASGKTMSSALPRRSSPPPLGPRALPRATIRSTGRAGRSSVGSPELPVVHGAPALLAGRPRSGADPISSRRRRGPVTRSARDSRPSCAGAGPADLALVGIGENGHVAYLEPARPSRRATVGRAAVGGDAARLAADGIRPVPREALTMGIETILAARRILLVATGRSKARALACALEGPVDARCPASYLSAAPGADRARSTGRPRAISSSRGDKRLRAK